MLCSVNDCCAPIDECVSRYMDDALGSAGLVGMVSFIVTCISFTALDLAHSVRVHDEGHALEETPK